MTTQLKVQERITKMLKKLYAISSSYGGKCLSNDYENIRQKLLWECKKGHKWYASANSILYSGSWCPYCAGSYKLSLIELRRLAEQKDGKCLASEYVNSKTKMLWQCKEGHQWFATAFSIKTRKSWCPSCYKTHFKKEKL
ncbi:MAG: zinc-ribbon domain-containing protein [Salinivirgaceae bacterium]